jgi:serine/threonine-protein kinase HipA
MSVNGKRDHFTLDDLITVGESISIPRPGEVIDEVADAVGKWPEFARTSGVAGRLIAEITRNHRIDLLK